jgi:hypothetical protein
MYMLDGPRSAHVWHSHENSALEAEIGFQGRGRAEKAISEALVSWKRWNSPGKLVEQKGRRDLPRE